MECVVSVVVSDVEGWIADLGGFGVDAAYFLGVLGLVMGG